MFWLRLGSREEQMEFAMRIVILVRRYKLQVLFGSPVLGPAFSIIQRSLRLPPVRGRLRAPSFPLSLQTEWFQRVEDTLCKRAIVKVGRATAENVSSGRCCVSEPVMARDVKQTHTRSRPLLGSGVLARTTRVRTLKGGSGSAGQRWQQNQPVATYKP